jgi:hypothetical protein
MVKLGSIPEVAVIDLITNLSKHKLELGKSTNALSFSNESVMYADIILEVFHRYAKECTLDVENWIEYVATEDIDLIAMYILKQIMPKGIKIIRTCNSIVKPLKEINDTLTTECNFSFTAVLDALEVINYLPTEITPKHKEILKRNRPNSVTLKEVETYQESLPCNEEFKVELSDTMSMYLKHPYAVSHIEQGKKWISVIEDTTDEILESLESSDRLESDTKLNVMKTMVLNKFCHFVDRLVVGDAFTTSQDDIFNALNRIIADKESYQRVVNGFVKYITSSRTTVIGIDNYVCPTCKSKQKTDAQDDTIADSIIPMNVYWSFLETCILKQTQMEKLIETT